MRENDEKDGKCKKLSLMLTLFQTFLNIFFDKNLNFKVKISSAIKSIQVRLMLTKGSGTCSARYYDRLVSTNRPLKVRLDLVWSGLFSLSEALSPNK
jgi:hypothetical protein